MRHVFRVAAFLLLLLGAGRELASAQQQLVLQPVLIGEDVTYLSGADILVLRETDETGLDISAAWAARSQFEPFDQNTIDFGYLSYPVWIMFRVSSDAPNARSAVISLGRPELVVADIFEIEDGEPRALYERGTGAIGQPMLRKYLSIAAPSRFEPGETKTIMVRMHSSQSSLLPLNVGWESAVADATQAHLNIIFVASAAALTILALNVLLLVLLKLGRLLWFPASQLLALVGAWQNNRYPNLFFPPMDRAVSRLVDEMLFLLGLIMLLQFARVYFRTRTHFPKADNVALSLMAFGTGLLVMEVAGFLTGLTTPGFLIAPVAVAWLAIIGMLIWFAVSSWRIKIPSAGLVALVWILYGGLVAYMVIESLTPLPPLPYQSNILLPLIVLEAFVITGGLGLYARRNLQDRIVAEEKLSGSLRNELIAMQDLNARSRVLLAMGHDGRNLVGGLKYLASGIRGASSLEDARGHASSLQDVAGMLSNMLNIMVDSAASGEGGHGPIAIEPVNVETLLSTVRIVSGSRAQQKAIPIHIHAGVKEVMTDHLRVFRILTNLVSNAGKYSEGGRILIACRRHGDTIRFQVFDQGIGLSEEQLETIRKVEPVQFSQDVSGEGVGLTLCHEYAEDLGGELVISSKEGRGSLFELRLPAAPALSDDTQLRVGIFGTQSNWPALNGQVELIDLGDAPARALKDVDAILIDDLHNPGAQNASAPALVATFDKSSGNRARWAGQADVLIYKPVTSDAIVAAMAAVSGTLRKTA